MARDENSVTHFRIDSHFQTDVIWPTRIASQHAKPTTMRWCCWRRPLQLRTKRRYSTARPLRNTTIAMRPLCTCCCVLVGTLCTFCSILGRCGVSAVYVCVCVFTMLSCSLGKKAWHCDSMLVFEFQTKIKKRHHSSFPCWNAVCSDFVWDVCG